MVLLKFFSLRRLPVYHHIIMKNLWRKKFYTTISLQSPQVPKSLYWLQGLESAIIFAHLFEGLAPTELCVSKSPNYLSFLFKSVWTLQLWNIKSKFSLKFWSFWDMIWQDVSFLSLDNQFITHWWASFHAKFGHKT